MLSKVLSLLIYPLSLGILLLLIAVASGAAGRRGLSWLMAFLALMVLYLPSTEFGSSALMTPLEGRHPAFSPEELPAADVIVVLGGALTDQPRFGRGGDFNQAADRLYAAAELYHAAKAPVILVSGGGEKDRRTEAALMTEKLLVMQVPQSAIVQETESRSTFENAVNSAEVLKRAGYKHILLVTSGAHMRRALALFEKQGFQVTAAATDHSLPGLAPKVPGWLPTVDRLQRSTLAIHEHVGFWVYDMSGKL